MSEQKPVIDRKEQKATYMKKVVSDLTDGLNSNPDLAMYCFIMSMHREHRELQSTFFSLCLKWIRFCASDDYRTDERNEWCKKFAQALIKASPNLLDDYNDEF